MLSSVWIRDFAGLFFPKTCVSCGKPLYSSEEVLCMKCQYRLPRTNFHLTHENPVLEIFGGRLPLYSATSFLFFNKGGMSQQLIHQLKYKGKKEIGPYVGKLFGGQLNKSKWFKDADALIPVPLHPKKQFKRGYNQSLLLTQGMASAMNAEVYPKILYRKIHSSTQTKKSRYQRWKNVKDIFEIKHAETLEGKHIILIDDVITTGATLEACGNKLMQIPGIKISVASLAYTQV